MSAARAGADELAAYLAERGMTATAVRDWLETPNTWLDNRIPSLVLAHDPDAVARAVRGLFQD